MANFIDFVYMLESMGVADVLLPFFLIFTVVFAVLSKTKILGKAQQARRFDVILSLVMGLAVVIPHVLGTYPPNADIVNIINESLPQVAVTIIAIIMLMLMIGAFGIKWDLADNAGGSLWVAISVIIIVYIFGTSAGWFHNGIFPSWLWWLGDPQTQTLLVSLLVFGVVIWFVTRDPEKEGEQGKGFSKILKELGKTKELDE